MSGSGSDEVSRIVRSIASRWSHCTEQRIEIIAVHRHGDHLPTGQSQNRPGEASAR
jgi:hypothetical protein